MPTWAMVAKSGVPSTVAPTMAVTSGYSALVAPSFSFTVTSLVVCVSGV